MHLVNAAVLEEWTTLADEAVVSHVLEGRVALFELLMRRHHARVTRVVHAIVRDRVLADDVVQQAFVTGYAHLRRFDRRGSFTRWLTRIAVTEALTRAGDVRCASRACVERGAAREDRSGIAAPRQCDRVVARVLARIA